MEDTKVYGKRSPWGPELFFLAVLCLLLSAPTSLFSASITNEGETAAKVNIRSTKGITGGGSVSPGKTLPLKSEIAWIEHVPEGGASSVRLEIIENDGTTGYIRTPGGRYTFQGLKGPGSPAAPYVETKTPPVLAPGYAENRSEQAMLLSLIDKSNAQRYQLLLPGQKVEIPKDIVEVISDRNGWSSGDVRISLLIVMPDGKEHTVRSSHSVVRIES